MVNITVPVNYLAVVGAAVVSMIIGSLWYGPLFGKLWMKEMGMGKQKMNDAMKNGMAKTYGLMFLGSLVMSFVLAHATIFAASYFKIEGVTAGLMSGFWNWLGFVAPVTLGSFLWEGKSFKLWLMNNGYYLMTLLAMGTVVSVWK
ncbi:DUF1761 domain-containing protein [Candidatus Roizmanbacteria bacterium]|nr:DUF1761 domain-containing protein [Candidatus Roizmanbacteria bacterium]